MENRPTQLVTQLAADRSEVAFPDGKAPLTAQQAHVEATRCLYCFDAPCIGGCPTRVDVPEFIRRIATGNLKGAARTVLQANILGASCARVCPVETLCASRCVLPMMGSAPIPIGRLQRYATDRALSESWRLFEAGPDTGKSIGLVGCGPASVAAAHALRRLGHACTLYEQRQVIGGLNTWGMAPYKLKADAALAELDYVLGIGGIAVETGVAVGRDLSWTDLRRRHDAIFIGVGIGGDRPMGVPGEDLPGVHGALAFIERMKLGRVSVDVVRSAVVVGGGNTAIDAVRELLGLGVPRVTLLYRRSREEKPGYEHEWQAAVQEGARAAWRTLPTAFEAGAAAGEAGEKRLAHVRCVQLDANRKPIAGTEQEVEADLALVAIGQTKLDSDSLGLDGVRIEGGRIRVDEHGFTGLAGVYAGGDCTNGGKEVVNAVAEGAAAAHAIDRYLRGESHA